MRVYASGLLVAAVTAGSALGQALLCPPSATPPARCDVFHYHVMMYRPDTRGFIELSGINQFASQSACERARDAAMRHNLAVVDFYRKRNDNRYEPDKFGPCHCDMSATYLNDAARNAQLRLAADTKLRVRERLMDAEVPTDSELMRSADPPAGSPFGAAKLVPLPPAPPPTTIANEPADLRMPKSEIGDAPAISDLPLVEIVPTPAMPPAPVATPATPEVKVDEPAPPADDPAEAFISVETDRIQKILAASTALSDVKILEACTRRLQVLSNLRMLIESSKGRLAADARAAHSESERLALVAKLFGSDMPAHWAPRDARDVVVELMPDPARVLREPSAPSEGKRHALYSYLATSPVIDEWVGGVVEALLQ
ncbi:MAG TPA: hypothetical protein VJZ76_17405 [Thermoanaerobaculia bacterium]|nr:hypothetical protein [Thermoanaerobaculia bacterium]